jgi:hypothetical protein
VTFPVSGKILCAPCYAPHRIASKLSNSCGVRASAVAGFGLDLAGKICLSGVCKDCRLRCGAQTGAANDCHASVTQF